jgi:signal transduction histidine kinase
MTGRASHSWLGEGPRAAARQAALLFALCGLLALLMLPVEPRAPRTLTVVAVADLAVAAAAYALPWQRWGPLSTAVLAVPALAVLGLSTWAFGGFAAGTGPFFVLLFAWLGLHQPVWVIGALVPAAAAAYAVPLASTGVPTPVLASTVVLVAVATAVGLLVSAQVRRLQQARAHVAQVERWRAALMAALAHDVRSPLTAIQGTLDLLAAYDDLPPARRQSLTEAASRQAARLTRLATGLLDLDRVEQGRLRLDLADVPLDAVVQEVSRLLGVADLDADVPAGLVVRADRERLEQIVLNLTTNALRHGAPPIVVGGDLDQAGDAVTAVLSVRDHGRGVPADEVPQLFERFTADDDPSSVGLGLWIVRLLAEAHGGTVHYEPADPGARFVVRLPQPGRRTQSTQSSPARRSAAS